jgi:uncharacterized protein YbbC (DUF1343 family)
MGNAVRRGWLPALLLALQLASCAQPSSLGRLRLGADQLFEEPYVSWIRGKRVGLITNQTGVDSRLESTAERLARYSEVRLTALFAPEHGIAGSAQAGEHVSGGTEYFSLYGDRRAPTPEMLSRVDVLIYDIQDVGVRFYTYISTLLEAMKAASRQRIPFMVLDRPNPIGGDRVEGPVLEPGFESFVGIHRLPIRYGMTAGELAGLLKDELGLDLVLWVVPMVNWDRRQGWPAGGLEWITPSPNMPTLRTAEVYPGTCLIEGTNLSEGRGTTRPFELIGAPWLQARPLAGLLNGYGLPGVVFRPQPFRPTFSKYAGQECQGIQIHVVDSRSFRPIETTLHLLREVLNLHPTEFQFHDTTFDRLAGNSWVRTMLLETRAPEAVAERWSKDLEEFRKRRAPYLLY